MEGNECRRDLTEYTESDWNSWHLFFRLLLCAVCRVPRAEDKEPYIIQAAHQQALIDDLATKPLEDAATKKNRTELPMEEDGDEVNQVWKNASKKISCRRLMLNKEAFRDHPIWQTASQFGDSHLLLSHIPGSTSCRVSRGLPRSRGPQSITDRCPDQRQGD